MDPRKLSNDEEDAFRKFIVVDADTPPAKPVRQPNTTPQQMNTIIAFVDDLSRKELTKEEYASQWNILANELNDNGPPEHTGLEWRRIWTVHKSNVKYNRKKRLKSDSSEEVTEGLNASKHEQSPQVEKSRNSDVAQSDDVPGSSDAVQFDGQFTTVEGSNISAVILEKLNVLVQKQNEMINLVTDLIQWLKAKDGSVKKDIRKSI